MIINPLTGSAYKQEVTELPFEKMQLFISLEELIKSLEISFYCEVCNRVFGPPHDGIRATVDSNYTQFRLTCNHRDRICNVKTPIKM